MLFTNRDMMTRCWRKGEEDGDYVGKYFDRSAQEYKAIGEDHQVNIHEIPERR